MDKYEQAYEKLRPKVIEISDIILEVLDKIESKEEFEHLPNSKFGRLIAFFTHMVLSIETTGKEEWGILKTQDPCLGKIAERMHHLESLYK